MSEEKNRGSEWRKWDLHLHSPYTNLNNDYKKISDEKFIEEIKKADVKIIGLTNYFKFQEEEFELKEKLEKEGITVFLNLELRLTYQNKEDNNCDFHIVFANDLTKENINSFLNNLTLKIGSAEKKANTLSSENDFKTATVEYEKLIKTLNEKSLNLKGKYFTGFLSRGHGNSRSSTQYGTLAKKCDFLIHSSDKQENLEQDRKFWLGQGKPLLQSSDAHKLDDIGNKFTWIKADPTFEGLKQIIYEPEQRVRIQEENPSFEYNKPFFSKLEINNDIKIFENENVIFQRNENIFLNKNLVTIIGGRGTGKSLLLKYFGNIFQKLENKFSTNENFKVVYQKENKLDGDTQDFQNNENNLDFVFIEQSKIKNITEGKGLKDEVKKLLGLEDLGFDKKLTKKIDDTLDEIQHLKDWFDQKNEIGDLIHSKKHNEEIKEENTKLLATITTKENKENIKNYTENITSIEKLKTQIKTIDDFKNLLEKYESELNKEIENINLFFEDENLKQSKINFKIQKEKAEKQEKYLTSKKESKEKNNQEIKTSFETQGFKGDISSLLQNAKTYQEKVEQAENKIKEINEKTEELKKKKDERKKLGEKIKEEYETQEEKLQNKWNKLLVDKNDEQQNIIKDTILTKDIDFEVSIQFNEQKFYEVIHKELDKRSFRDIDAVKKVIGILTNFEEWVTFFDNEKFGDLFDNDNFKNFISNIFFDLNTRSQYIQVLPELTYQKKTIDKLSAGQKGTLYLRLQLATNAFSTPIIFDQPEDDLDNKFIISELVPLIQKLKYYRQIIIATHNANLVVSADAEQIIIANNDNESLSYKTGTIENEEIRNEICEILEGGKDAFQKRKQKYNLN